MLWNSLWCTLFSYHHISLGFHYTLKCQADCLICFLAASEEPALETLTDVLNDYLSKVGQLLRVAVDREATSGSTGFQVGLNYVLIFIEGTKPQQSDWETIDIVETSKDIVFEARTGFKPVTSALQTLWSSKEVIQSFNSNWQSLYIALLIWMPPITTLFHYIQPRNQ